MYTVVLIVIMGFSTSQSGSSSVSVNFQKMDQCLVAKSDIEKQAQSSREDGRRGAFVVSSGCYEQGRTQ